MESNKSVTISARVPGNTITIFGYTSPNSRVELSNTKTFAVTYSQDNGYFIFESITLPRHSQDLCLSSQDESNRPTYPVCISEPPLANSYTEIGPILLSPTISLDLENQYTSGQSIPNSIVEIHFYQQSSPLSFVKKVQAFSLPTLTTQTDSRGNYSFSLPLTTATNYRLFSTAQYLENNSSKSNTLLYQPYSVFSLLLFLLPLLLISLSLYFLFKKKRLRFLPFPIYNKSIVTYHD